MAKAIITLKIMPESPDVDLAVLQEKALTLIATFSGNDETKVTTEPVAFGLKSLNIIFVMDESKGSADVLEEEIESLEGVMSCETTDVRRAIG
ncbi:MAG: elongation factor 1-beta [Candidatus Woesearchaeota archaeon]